MNNRMNDQGGSVLSFTVVGVLLAVALVGGLFWLQNYRNGIEEKEQEIAVESDEKSDSVKDDNKTPADTSDTDKVSTSNDSNESEGALSDDAASDSKTDTADVATEELPETGPADNLLQFIGLSILTFATVGYVRSRSAL